MQYQRPIAAILADGEVLRFQHEHFFPARVRPIDRAADDREREASQVDAARRAEAEVALRRAARVKP